MTVTHSTVGTTIADGLATITLARPTASNALDVPTKQAFLAAVDAVAADPAVRAVLLAAQGTNFCVGQDLAEHVEGLRADPSTAMETVGVHYNPLIKALTEIQVPVVVAIRGACVGAGLGIALTGDIRVVGAGAKFATAFTGIGLASDSGLSHAMVHALGYSRAVGLMLLGDRFTATEALTWGLVHRVVDDEEVEATARELARSLAQGPTEAYRHLKRLLRTDAAGLADALEREQAAQEALGATRDHSAAVEAFLTKSPPVFEGR
ncbi:enoyl-CoA hydratase/isomerase family protein [Nocardia sp. CA-084685]|uniref:enoyl-CoA hydratase/isomerase family protein n=1 Tax=Nocardia sp. CA-084685 TaxID=3239970 RepID=UPI003D96304D